MTHRKKGIAINPKFLITCASKFHSDHIAYHLQKRNKLYRVISSFPSFIYANREKINRKKFKLTLPVAAISRVFNFKNPKRVAWTNYLVARLFDFFASFKVGKPNISISFAECDRKSERIYLGKVYR
jgi:hypothetical protein